MKTDRKHCEEYGKDTIPLMRAVAGESGNRCKRLMGISPAFRMHTVYRQLMIAWITLNRILKNNAQSNIRSPPFPHKS